MALKYMLELADIPAGPPVIPLPELASPQKETLEEHFERVTAEC